MRGSLRFGSSVEVTYGFYITATSSTYLLSQKSSITDVWLDFKHASVLCDSFQKYLQAQREVTF